MPYPFHWVPAAGQRHATLDARPGGGYPTGISVETLCGVQICADNSEFGWLWPTYPECAPETRRLAEEYAAAPKPLFG
ncbi:zinc finger protein [Saccharopolyspora sp. SCSIO 74807]|uniref:zinc finger protein n=1 Tax=Saccharopolyspora sp. SCSIO 74807 TaxID=3118084 RepID=UPI00387E7D9B